MPLDDRRIERFDPDLAGRTELIRGSQQLLFGGMGWLTENTVINVKNKSHAVTAEVVVPEGGANGVIVAQGGAFGGWSLYVIDGRPAYCYNLFGLQQFKVYGDEPLPAGDHQVRMEFGYDGGGRQGWGRRAVRGRREGGAALTRRSRWSSPRTRPRTSAATAPPP